MPPLQLQQPQGIRLVLPPVRTIPVASNNTPAAAPVRTVQTQQQPHPNVFQRIGNFVTGIPGAIVGTAKDVGQGAAKFVNQGVQEAKQVADTGRMVAATVTHNQNAFRNANQQSQSDYKGFGNKGGLFNQGTITTQQEAKQGSAHGAEKIAGDTAMLGSLLIPGVGGVAAKGGSLATKIGVHALQGAITGGAFGAGQAMYHGGTAKDVVKSGAENAAFGAVLGGGGAAAGSAIRAGVRAAGNRFAQGLKPVFAAGKGTPVNPDESLSSVGDIAKQRVDQLKSAKGGSSKPSAPKISSGTESKPGRSGTPAKGTPQLQQTQLPIENQTTENVSSTNSNIKVTNSQASRPNGKLQTQIEAAHNAGNTALEAKLVAQLPDQAMNPNASLSPEARQALLDRMQTGDNAFAGGNSGTKPSRFANVTIQNSDKVDELTKQLVQEKNVMYNPAPTKAGQDLATQNYGSMDPHQAALQVGSVLNDTRPGMITRQDVFNAHEVAKNLQATGDTADKAAAADIYAKLSEHHTAAGQQIQAAAALAKQSPEGMLYSATKALQKAGVKMEGKVADKVNQAIDDYKAATKDINPDNMSRKEADTQSLAYQKFVDTVNKQIPRSKYDAALGIWRAGLLTGPETAAKVAVSHLITAPAELASKPITSIVDRLTSLATGKRAYTFTPGDLVTGAKGYGRGVQAAGLKLRTGLDLPHTGGFDNPLGRTTKETAYEKVPTRLHASIAKPNFSAEYNMSLKSQARAEAINQGLKGADRAKFINDFMDKPPKAAAEKAQADAEHFTNQNRTMLGGAASKIQSTPYVGKILAPFTRIPGAIGTKGLVDWTPLGFGKAIYKIIDGVRNGNFDQRGFSQAIGRATTGTGVAAIGFEMMGAGRMTLQAPNDPKERALWYQEGKQANSIYVGGSVTKNKDGTYTYQGGKWLSLNAFGPAGITMGIGGAYKEAQNQGKTGPAAVVQGFAGGSKVLADQPYLKGISGVANAINDPTRYAQSWYDSTVGSIIPAISSQIARGSDTTERAFTPGVTNTLKGEIPGQREKLPAQLDTFGQPVPSGNGGSIGADISGTVNPFYPQESRNQSNPATAELQRLYTTAGSQGAPAFAAPQKSMTIDGKKLVLTPQQMEQYVAASGPLIEQGINNLLQNPDYQKLTDDQKTAQINSVITGAHTAAKVSLFNANPKTLSGVERTAILNPGNLGKDVQLAGLKLADNVQPADKQLLTKVYSMTSAEKTSYLNDPKNKYQYDLASYHNDLLNGKYDSVQQQSKEDALAKQAITSQYDNKVTELYGMSKNSIVRYLNAHPGDAGNLTKQLLALDNALYNAGSTGSLKFKDGIISADSSSKRGSGNKIQTAGTSFGSTFSKLNGLLSATERSGRGARGAGARRVAMRPYKSGGKNGNRFHAGSAPKPPASSQSTPKPPKFFKVGTGSVGSKRIKLSV